MRSVKPGARRAYESLRQLLADTLGVAPTPSTTGLLTGPRPRVGDADSTPAAGVLRRAPAVAQRDG